MVAPDSWNRGYGKPSSPLGEQRRRKTSPARKRHKRDLQEYHREYDAARREAEKRAKEESLQRLRKHTAKRKAVEEGAAGLLLLAQSA
ncbi:hypothetical protein CALCODRAFT_479940 [Calocera cornea HHB12733]|uniref:rRNA-processing protein FYV7 n=1 Tax=Calocera cornea HHB12733 TaxID=1353952 RepID=A0A165J6S8_9BASI|nr:hypothetical protein CALCODRAFT_479940 [Calocera cornea HHB12733]